MSFLKKIKNIKEEEIKYHSSKQNITELKEICASSPPLLKKSFSESLREDKSLSIIAEVKQASPSRGLLVSSTFDPSKIALGYEKSGAKAISILTDKDHFKGDFEHLKKASKSVKLPCLQKDFFIDDYQVYQAKTFGASAILLIVKLLSFEQLQHLHGLAKSLDLDVLVEIHGIDELAMIEDLEGIEVLGINNRNLDTLAVDVNQCFEIKKSIPPIKNLILIAESGLETVDDFKKVHDSQFDGALVGSALMSTNDPAQKLSHFIKVLKA
ncbi:hypothetical protein AB834_04220 [PVC group bacterium (ex Bugula neritina AB1)]|nr:hypothetical protein AB834_04220 [PVC group bacterium (ex Bugula neritina AB1)]